MPAWLVPVIISTVLSVVSIVIRPKAPRPQPEAVRDLESPTADAGRPIPRFWGSMRIAGLNVLDTREASTYKYDVKS